MFCTIFIYLYIPWSGPELETKGIRILIHIPDQLEDSPVKPDTRFGFPRPAFTCIQNK